jgi:hypothetical protein
MIKPNFAMHLDTSDASTNVSIGCNRIIGSGRDGTGQGHTLFTKIGKGDLKRVRDLNMCKRAFFEGGTILDRL